MPTRTRPAAAPSAWRRFHKAARSELGAAGTALLAERTEQLRADWVRDRMVALGRGRSRALGWPDAYAFTKSLGENALLDMRGELPVTFVRPSIVESALAEPRPGWIRGFRMAEPVIISYARGLLRQFPGVPEGIVDVIPVDLVVAALIAVAAKVPTRPARPSTRSPRACGTRSATASSSTSPRAGSPSDPSTTTAASRSSSRSGPSPAGARSKASCAGPRRPSAPPSGSSTRSRCAASGPRPPPGSRSDASQAERALSYVELYGAYSETEARFRIDRTLRLFESLEPADQARRSASTRPSSTGATTSRTSTCPRSSSTPGSAPPRRQADDGEPRGALAEGDPVRPSPAARPSTSRTPSSPRTSSRAMPGSRPATSTAPSGPASSPACSPRARSCSRLDRRDRSDFLRAFYRRYDGAPVDQLRLDGYELFSDLLGLRAFPEAIARVRRHRALGHKTLLITGALDFVVEPLRPLFDEIVCASLGERDGKFTGELTRLASDRRGAGPAPRGVRPRPGPRASATPSPTRTRRATCPCSRPPGFPVAVNPEAKLAAIARRRGWSIEHWERAAGGPRRTLAIADPPPGRPDAVRRLAGYLDGGRRR